MANCVDCNVWLGFLNTGTQGRCSGCTEEYRRKLHSLSPDDAQQIANAVAEVAQREEAIEQVLLTTETAPSLKITKRIEIVTAEVAYGMNIFKDLFAGFRDIVGGRSEAVQGTMRDARRTALYELKKEAHSVGANAVVGVDLDYVELSGSSNMVMLVASGTAVIIEDEGY
jgi:uncharacterized protein YbjQ (UPF0145 family)